MRRHPLALTGRQRPTALLPPHPQHRHPHPHPHPHCYPHPHPPPPHPVVRGDPGDRTGTCFIDDHVRRVEPVWDYLTRFSGVSPGDLDVGTSRHHLTSLKKAYLKLRYLVDCGCVLVGHGLR